jgi:hypothetical protein
MANRVLGTFVALGVSLLLVSGGVATAAAATNSHASVRSALAILGVKASDELVENLSEDGRMGRALAKGKDKERSASDDGSDTASASGSPSANSVRVADWRDRFATAREGLKAAFVVCRDTATGHEKSVCARDFAQGLKIASMQTLIAALNAEITRVNALVSTAETTAALDDLNARLERAEAKLARFQELGAANGRGNNGKWGDAPGRAGTATDKGTHPGLGKGLHRNAPGDE